MNKIVVEVSEEVFNQIKNLPLIKETYGQIKTVYFDYDPYLVFINKGATIE